MLPTQFHEASIVILGSFNPKIFHPAWFSANDLLSVAEADAATVNIIHPDVASFKTEWIEINVVRERFVVRTAQEDKYEPLRDLVVGILELLRHTPIRVMGINRSFHFDLKSEQAWHKLGHTLVPKDKWSTVLDTPGMRVVIVEGKRPDDYKGYVRVQVEPSNKITFGVFIDVNDHYVLVEDEKDLGGTDKAAEILSKLWDESMKRGLRIAEAVSKIGEEE